MNEQLLSFIAGASAAIVGGIIGGFVQGWAWYGFDLKRVAREETNRWTQKARNWAINGRNAKLQCADLEGAYLQGVDLEPEEGGNKGADLSYANLRGAYLKEAKLKCVDLRGAHLDGAKLRGANLEGANLNSADLRGADLKEVVNLKTTKRKGTKYSNDTIWPKEFKTSIEMCLVDERWWRRSMNEQDWGRVVRRVTNVLALALAAIPGALALAVRVFLWAAGLP